MAAENASQQSVAALQARWQAGSSPQVGLRLAEALHEGGQRVDAERILDEVEERLAEDPANLSARVALGRLRLMLHQAEAAARALEPVVQSDPTHLRANKLLVEVYLELGQRDRAQDRLDLYRLLNEGDPEIEALEGLLVGVPVEASRSAALGSRQLRLAGGDPFAPVIAAAPPPPPQDSLFALPAPALAAPVAAATATLGELYRQQGFREEAESIFREVLDREPDNNGARHGLTALGEAAGLAADAELSEAGGEAAGSPREQRIQLLRGYLARIRSGRERLGR